MISLACVCELSVCLGAESSSLRCLAHTGRTPTPPSRLFLGGGLGTTTRLFSSPHPQWQENGFFVVLAATVGKFVIRRFVFGRRHFQRRPRQGRATWCSINRIIVTASVTRPGQTASAGRRRMNRAVFSSRETVRSSSDGCFALTPATVFGEVIVLSSICCARTRLIGRETASSCTFCSTSHSRLFVVVGQGRSS